jgi:hypothetical protein
MSDDGLNKNKLNKINTMTTQAQTIIPGLDTANDMLSTTGHAWNSKFSEVHETILVRDAKTFPFARFEYDVHQWPGSKWAILKCSDTGHEIGQPFKVGSYYVMNNERLQRWIETLMAGIEKMGLKLSIQTAGTLKNRERQFVSFKIEGLDKIDVGGREIRTFLSLLKGLDKLVSFTLVNSTITVCCANTFAMVHGDTGAPLYARVKFTKNCEVKIDEVPRIVDAFIAGNNAMFAKLKHWHSIGVSELQAEQLFAAWLGNEDKPMSERMANVVKRLRELHGKFGKGNKGETALDAFNAVTEYYTHESAGESKDIGKQIESSEVGDGAEKKGQFFDYLTKALASSDTFTGVCKVGDKILVATDNARKAKA